MTSLDCSDDVTRGKGAALGEVRRWRAFSLLAVAYFMTAVDLTIVNVPQWARGQRWRWMALTNCSC